MTRSYRFLRSPKWIALLLLVTALVAFMLSLSRWQFDRLAERRAENVAINAGLSVPAGPLSTLPTGGEDWLFRAVSATGEYATEGQTLVESRSLNNDPGLWIVTPLDLDAGGSILVMRGWIAVGAPIPAAPEGVATIEGVVLPGEGQRNVGPRDNAETVIFTRVDLGLIGLKSNRTLGEVYLQLTASDTDTEPAPTILPAPFVEGEGSHKGYALQWLGFSLTAVIGLIALVRNEAGKRADG
jgi:cytochrome oxidase assembly protein ShyY1